MDDVLRPKKTERGKKGRGGGERGGIHKTFFALCMNTFLFLMPCNRIAFGCVTMGASPKKKTYSFIGNKNFIIAKNNTPLGLGLAIAAFIGAHQLPSR